MKKWVIILIVIAVIIVIAVVAKKYYDKKREEKEKELLNGITKKQFYDRIIPKWKDAWVDGAFSSESKNRDYLIETAYIHCKELFEVCEESLSGKPKNCEVVPTKYDNYQYVPQSVKDCALPIIKKNIEEAFYKEKPNPLEVSWANTYWLPIELEKMGVEIHREGVKEIINGIPNEIKK